MTVEIKQSDGRVVSFIEKQLAVTQKRHAEMEASLAEVMAAIEDNARLQMHLHELSCDVMRCPDLSSALQLLLSALKERFSLKDVVIWGQEGSLLPRVVPSGAMLDFMEHLAMVRSENGEGSRFPIEAWSVPNVISGCAFRLIGRGSAFGVLVLGRQDEGFVGEIDTLFLQQFVDVMGFWLESQGAAGSRSGAQEIAIPDPISDTSLELMLEKTAESTRQLEIEKETDLATRLITSETESITIVSGEETK